MGGEPTALSARPCRQPDNKRSTFDYRRHWKASRTSLRRRSTRRPKAQLPPRLTTPADPLRRRQNGNQFVLSWVIPTRRNLSQPLHYDGAGGELSDQNRPPVDGVANLNLPTKLLEVRSNFAPYYIFATLTMSWCANRSRWQKQDGSNPAAPCGITWRS